MSEPSDWVPAGPGQSDPGQFDPGQLDDERCGIPGLRLLGVVGRGARSIVYRAERNGRQYAVKMQLEPGSAEESIEFTREAALLAVLSHPGLVRIHEAGQACGRVYIVMDLIEGRPLRRMISDRSLGLSDRRVADFGAQIAETLAAAHAAGRVHRDIKPDNILVGWDGRVRLIDFGLADRVGRSCSATAAGTFAYSAPEQTGLLHRPVDARSDLYSLGVVLFECCSGRLPFVADEVGELIRLHLAEPVPDLLRERATLAPALAQIVARLLAKDPDDRYQTAEAARDDLARVAAGEREFGLSAGAHPTCDDRPVPAGMSSRLFGREPELAQLLSCWGRAIAGRGGAALVVGPPGIGKSRLAREFGLAVRASGYPFLTGKASEGCATPLGPLREVIDPGLRQPSAQAVAGYLISFADRHGGAILHLDDAQWWDQATGDVVRCLGACLEESRLLLIVTARDEAGGVDVVGPIRESLGETVDLQLAVGPLEEASVGQLMADVLRTPAAPAELVLRLAAYSGGNPLAVLEYLQMALDLGVLRPSWGRWLLDRESLRALALPDDVFDLLLRRIEALPSQTRGLLVAAATIGQQFSVGLVTEVTGLDHATAAAALAGAADHRLIEPVSQGYAFLHDRIREALLRGVDSAERGRLHQRVAQALDAGPVGDTAGEAVEEATVYAVAQHYLLGDGSTPERLVRAATAAGSSALAAHAAAEAYRLLCQARDASAAAGIALDAGFLRDLGTAASRIGQPDVALQHLQRALELERDPIRRAELFGLMAETHHLFWEGDRAIAMVRLGLAELGDWLPTGQRWLAVTSAGRAILASVIGLVPRRLRPLSPARRERHRLAIRLLSIASKSAVLGLRVRQSAAITMRSTLGAKLLGRGPEFALIKASMAISAGTIGRIQLRDRLIGQALAEAAALRDPGLTATIHYMAAVSHDLVSPASAASGTFTRRVLVNHSRWLDVGQYLELIGIYGILQLMRGYGEDAATWYRRGRRRAGDDLALGKPFATLGPRAAALAGMAAEAASGIDAVQGFLDRTPGNVGARLVAAIADLHIVLEQGELGQPFEDAAARFEAMGLGPRQVWSSQRVVWAYLAFGRLAQAAKACEESRDSPDDPSRTEELRAEADRRLRAAAGAVRRLERAVNGPVLRGFHVAAAASLDQLAGRPEAALRRLARACDGVRFGAARFGAVMAGGTAWGTAGGGGLIGGGNAPLVDYEVARVRARALRDLGLEADARRQADLAAMIAVEHGWRTRARWVRAEFDPEAASSTWDRRSVVVLAKDRAVTRRGTPGETELQARRLKALHQVSLAAATVIDPRQLSRVALDEIVQIFGAERAFLFLTDPQTDLLRPYLGRCGDGTDLEAPTRYSASLVERVRESGAALVVTGSEEGAALGSRSALVHGLRSIMVAPVRFKGRLLGVVYLDSRAAKGIFTPEDSQMLSAITTQVAVAFETARAAQLELDVRAAQRERDVAETLRAAMTDMAANLDPDEVAARIVATVTRAVPSDVAVLFCHLPASEELIAVTGDAKGQALSANDPIIAGLLAATTPARGLEAAKELAPLFHLLVPGAAAWLAIPLMIRGRNRGLLVIASTVARPHAEAETEIAAALAGQGIIAYDNAVLFQRNEELAIRDGLTGLYNRRHFFEEVRRLLAAQPPADRAVSAVMVDIDYFKQVNDTYGHLIGDDVIREVAVRLQTCLGEGDVMCRYGGEEFAVLLTGASARDSHAVAERLHQAVAGQPILTAVGPISVTVSVGLSGPVRPTGDAYLLLHQADEALYEAKRAGRDRVCEQGGP
ncbi:MAG: diguanylate cyclase [Micromonosporaceae bacterium]|nr:diguanylate cyclase [Micromonosporaceae bacterium]